MPTPDPYAAGGSDSPGPANSMPDQETATPDEGTADQQDETDTSGEEGDGEMGLKNHLYLPEKFPMDKPPKEGDKKDFLINAEYIKDENGEMCWKELTADGVPLDDEAADTEEDKGDQGADEAAEGEAPENEPATASTPNDVTKMIMKG